MDHDYVNLQSSANSLDDRPGGVVHANWQTNKKLINEHELTKSVSRKKNIDILNREDQFFVRYFLIENGTSAIVVSYIVRAYASEKSR